MAQPEAKKRIVIGIAVLALLVSAGLYAVANQVEESSRQRVLPVAGGKYHVLPATLETT
jgi:hypothetical protein